VPERTTPKQRIIALIREHLAEPGVTVTESKMLLDSAAGKLREVDVVAEGNLGGDPMILSVEVIEHSRPATLTWVDQMLGKHDTMPTNKLILVSWSGFTKAAQAKADASPIVATLTPESVVEPDGTQRQSKALYIDQLSLTPEAIAVGLRSSDGTVSELASVSLDMVIFDEHGTMIGTLRDLASSFLKSENVRRQTNEKTHNRDDREHLNRFTYTRESIDDSVRLYVYLTAVDPPESAVISTIEIDGRFSWQQTELRFDVVDIGGRTHGIARVPWLGKDAVWVATPKDDGSDEVKISWRATGSGGE
jgi:hypothetical protein